MAKRRNGNISDLAYQRRSDILSIVESRETISTLELANQFDVSIVTITRDLQELEKKGQILRVHGGATSVRGGGYEHPYLTRENRNLEEKQKIASAAFEMINEGDSIILDVGTTIHELAILLKTRTRLTVIVTSILLAQTLTTQPGIELIVIGGKFRSSEFSMVGHLAESDLKNFYVDKAFLGAAGIHTSAGITEYSVEQAGTKKVIIEQARQKIVLADHTKFGKIFLASVCPITSIDTIITDSGLATDIADRYRHTGVKLHIA